MLTPDLLTQAVETLRRGGVIALPTETVYGLAANAEDELAVRRVFAIKGRPATHPLIVHVARAEELSSWARHVPEEAQRLAAAFWPGPLTLVLPRSARATDAVTGGQDTVAVRVPNHPVALAVLAALGGGVAAPSANRFGRISPTTAAHVSEEFGEDLLVLDGGAAQLGIESAIVDCSRDRPALLRPGTLTRERLEAALGAPLGGADSAAPRAPGTLEAHYAPRARLRLMSTQMLRTALEVLGSDPLKLAVYSRSVPSGVATGVRHRRMPARPEQAAHELFAVLRELDNDGVHLIWVEEPPPGPEWDGVRDRLSRAAAT
jgi:L-threonylcarbamoyladenylate synthase